MAGKYREREAGLRVPVPEQTVRVRLDLTPEHRNGLHDLAHASGRLTMSTFARIAMELLVEKGEVTPEAVKNEAERRRLLAYQSAREASSHQSEKSE